ncbi:BPSL0067 family protein [Salmonella enterica]
MFGNKTIDAWTVFAIFVNGRYPDHNSGNPAAFYLGARCWRDRHDESMERRYCETPYVKALYEKVV